MVPGQEDMETGQPAVPDRVYSMANAFNVQTKVSPRGPIKVVAICKLGELSS